jgi:hypothetical protein
MTKRERVKAWRKIGNEYERRSQMEGVRYYVGHLPSSELVGEFSADTRLVVGPEDMTFGLQWQESALLCYLIAEVLNV